ncbi:ADP-ribosylglycohydrolase family protein [Corynebacterium casei]|uniref:ADP-ribosylglycohydrolase family protein n=1 Tax=Corynebacterium casei TaxID=160386 RepID=UPI003F8DBC94
MANMNAESMKVTGALMGLPVGDALGTTLEFAKRDALPPVTDIVGGGHYGLEPGQWTDDTSMALCLADSLLDSGSFDFGDQLRRYKGWMEDGYFSSAGKCFGIGQQTVRALGNLPERAL